jgi:spore germination cell wall hydrolase CwlJ-like protein
MQTPRNPQISRADRVLLTVMAVILATVSAVAGAAANYRPAAFPVAVVAPAPASAQDMVLTGLIAEHRCLAEALYYEARGEGSRGEKAVAEVVFHRMEAGNFGNSICAVVYEGAGHHGCQFSFTCNGELKRPREEAAWQKSEELAAQILTGEERLRNMTGGATHYHAVWMRPFWAPTLKKTGQIGGHIFYRAGRGPES